MIGQMFNAQGRILTEGTVTRMGIFLRERFPARESVFGFFQSLLTLVFLDAFAGAPGSPKLGTPFLLGMAVTVTGFLLLIRVADDLKDHANDQRLFPRRALARGDVLPQDLAQLGLATFTSLVLTQIVLIAALPDFPARMTLAAAFFSCSVYIFLMWKWFYQKELLSTSLPLAFATHNPVSVFIGLYASAPFWNREASLPGLFLFVIGNAGFAAAWEISRKIRPPSQETEYVTYSKLWGPRLPTLLTGGALTLALVGLPAPFWATRGFSPAFAILGLGSAAALFTLGRFLLNTEKSPPAPAVAMVAVSLILFIVAALFGA